MVDTVTAVDVFKGFRRAVRHITNESDGTGESGIVKVSISNYEDAEGNKATYSTVDLIEYTVDGFGYVELAWDRTPKATIAVLKGTGVIDWAAYGGKTDPGPSKGTAANIILTTVGAVANAAYDISIHFRHKIVGAS